MQIIEGRNINQMVHKVLTEIETNGHRSSSRNGDITALYDVSLKFTNPRSRHLNLDGRTNNIFATIAEIFWVMAGEDNIEDFLSYFIPRAPNYSDDGGRTWSAAYGERMYRHDQMQNIVDMFKVDGKMTRRATLSIFDPAQDTMSSYAAKGIESPKDIPCFAGDTNVLTMSGYKQIKDIKKDDLVLTYNTETEVMEPKKVEWSGQTKVVDEIYELELKSGEKIKVTEDHIVFIKRKQSSGRGTLPYIVEEVKVKDLKEGDYILSNPIHLSETKLEFKYDMRKNKSFDNLNTSRVNNKIVSIKILKETLPVYDLTIEDNHNFVIDGGWIVHNCNQHISFFVTPNDKLNMKVIQRSGDIIFGTGNINLPEFSVLQELILQELQEFYPELTLGYYNHSVTNLHLYDFTASQSESILNRKQVLTRDNNTPCIFPKSVEASKEFFKELVDSFSNVISNETIANNDVFKKIDSIFNFYNVTMEQNMLYGYSLAIAGYINYKHNRDSGISVELFEDLGYSDEFIEALNNNHFNKGIV